MHKRAIGMSLVVAIALSVAVAGSAQAATAPAPVSDMRVYARYDHTLRATWSVPSAVYQTGVRVVVRYTRGRTPAASPSAGYVATFLSYPHVAQARPLVSAAAYTFAVWVRDAQGRLSARRTVTAVTLDDVTAPHDLAAVSNDVTAAGTRTARVRLNLTYQGNDPDIAAVRVVRNTVPTTTGGTVFTVPGRPSTFTDPTVLPRGTHYYYWAIPRDASNHYATRYVATAVDTSFYRLSGHYTEDSAQSMDPPVVTPVGDHSTAVYGYAVGANDTWSAYVHAGRWTVCQAANNDPGQHYMYISGCWSPTGVRDVTGPGYPPGTEGAVDATNSDVSGIDLWLTYV